MPTPMAPVTATMADRRTATMAVVLRPLTLTGGATPPPQPPPPLFFFVLLLLGVARRDRCGSRLGFGYAGWEGRSVIASVGGFSARLISAIPWHYSLRR